MVHTRPTGLAISIGALASIAVAGCSATSASGSGPSITQTPADTSTPVAAPWQCPASPDSAWPASEHKLPGTMVPPGPTIAVECTYRKDRDHPAALVEKPVTYTGPRLADLMHSFNTAMKPNHGMSCPGPTGVEYTVKYNLIYRDGKSAIVTRTGYCPPVISNGTLTQQQTQPPSTPSTP